jgi:deoxyribodipyrimidine photo-lyase
MLMDNQNIVFFWFRRDLRLDDNAGLYHALKSGMPVLPVFIFDTDILSKLTNPADKRVLFIHKEIHSLKQQLEALGSTLLVFHGKPLEIWQKLIAQYPIKEVYCNRDYEPYARERDKSLYDWFLTQNISFKGYKDQVVFEKNEVVKADGSAFLVFSPYMRRWKERLSDQDLQPFLSKELLPENLYKSSPSTLPSLADMGFTPEDMAFPERDFDQKVIANYHKNRNFPAIKGTSRLGVHLRFGTISIRKLAQFAIKQDEKYLNELIWREFFMMALYFTPTAVNKAIKPKYDRIVWENNEAHFKAWCTGHTGYPIVDAGMRELNQTGFMHNRVRMIVASFLTKHLLIDWRWGEAYFAEKLLDYEQSSNIGGWQWAAGSGLDAAPYFRVFNPTTQAEKFDPKNTYIKKWVPEYGTPAYAKPIVEHKFARERALARFKEALQ